MAVPVFILITLVVLAGCATAPAAPTDTPAPPTPTQPQRPTLPPSWTPGPAPTQGALATATATPHTPRPAQAADDGRPTLPPSWTPQPFATVTRPPLTGPIATPLPPTITPVVEPTSGFGALQGGRPAGGPPTPARNADYPAACRTFAMSAPTDAVLPLDSDARLAWAAVEGADGYHVWVMNPSFRYAFDQGTTETAITIPASTFIGTGMYAWEVMPVRDGDRMCPSRTGVFTLRRD